MASLGEVAEDGLGGLIQSGLGQSRLVPVTQSPSRRLASPGTPIQLAARGILRKYKRLQKSSPISSSVISTTTRHNLLAKFAPIPAVASSVGTLDFSSILLLLKEKYSALNVEYLVEDGIQEWVVVSR